MEIREALAKLSGFIDVLYDTGVLSEDEADTLDYVEDTIYEFVREHGGLED